MFINLRDCLLAGLCFTFVVGACSPVQIAGPDLAPAAELASPFSATETPVILDLLPSAGTTALATIQPADTLPTALPTPTASVERVGNRIQFSPGGTWVELNGFLEQGKTITYTLSAMQGQIMSVSVRQSWPFAVQVADANQLLTDPNTERPYWRGSLPATGEYFISLTTYSSGEYSLRVAINPPGQARQFFNFRNGQHAGALRYSDEFAPTEYIPAGDFKGEPVLALELIRMDLLAPVTNLSEAYFLFSSMDDPNTVATCTQTLSPQEVVLGQEVFNGYEFTRSEMFGAGAGNIYQLEMYRSVVENVCYEAVFFMHSGNIGNYPPGLVTEFDQAALMGKFKEILSSFSVQ
jgi:hypothetical protein